ncbi:hypothetical protein PT974_02916 [Cladobotryum mycophilum]|uniref:Uncharacterized protein n=1 Tax=Cladobotryum mycophilum TaxID=491253 RepID=A0ABR0SZE7_9HYPO
MAPLTCQVVDALNTGVPGVHVSLDCWDKSCNPLARLRSVTGSDGGIYLWFPTALAAAGETEPQIVDTANITQITLTFFPRSVSVAPWLSVAANLYLPGQPCHGVILHLVTTPWLEHTVHPVAGPMRRPIAASRDDTPSPLLLPPPVFTPPGVKEQAEASGSDAEREANTIIVRKRKLAFEGGEKESRTTRRRLV